MNVPMRWLNDFVDTGLSPKDLADRMTMAGLETENIEEIGAGWDNVYVGLVERVAPHPNADKLVLADVTAGDHRLTVVTGAPNIRQGQNVALALAGARLVDGHSDTGELKTLKPGVIRGVRSEGMVCSEKELGLSGEHEGILVLEPDAPVGAPLKDWLGDTVIEFEITPNLVHAFSVHGVAREAAALTNKPLHMPETADLRSLPTADERLVRIEAPNLCARYLGIVVEGVTVGPSPDWLARRLSAVGLRPINNVVDATQYVMHEWGQPLHAFDRDRLHEGRIVVRRAKPGETLETLDHQQRQLTPDMLVIADADRAVALAGIIGGGDSEVAVGTATVLLEGATFEMTSVRHTARALKLRTDASARFERGIDPNLVAQAMARAIHLILELCPGSRVTAVADVYPRPVKPSQLSLPFSLIERVLGVAYPPADVLDVLNRLGFAPILAGEGGARTLTVTVPTFRSDVRIAADVVEEVARIIGYDTLPSTLPHGQAVPVRRDRRYLLQQAARAALVAAGGNEAITYVTLSEAMLGAFTHPASNAVGFVREAPLPDLLRVRNPLQADRPILRPTLIPSLLEAASSNLKHESGVRLYEFARVYLPRGRDQLPDEVDLLGIVLVGQREPLSLHATPGDLDFFDLKGTVEETFRRIGLRGVVVQPHAHPALHPGRTALALVGGQTVALMGELRPDVAASFDIEQARVCVAEIDLAVALGLIAERAPEVAVPRFLPVQQDFAVVVAEATPAAEVAGALLDGAGALATAIALFDIYRGPQIGEGTKSLAYRVTFAAPNRALTDAELVKVRGRLERVLKQRVNGLLRA